MPEFQHFAALPTLVPAAFGLVFLVFAPFIGSDKKWMWAFTTAAMGLTILIPAIILSKIGLYGDVLETAGVAGQYMVRTDRLALWLDILFGIAGLLALLVTPAYLERANSHRPEIYPLFLIAVSGMTAMVGSDHLVMIFVGLEVLSITLYVMCGLARERAVQVEAALKYFLLGAFSTSFLVFGLALILGATGRLDIPGIAGAVLGVGAGTLWNETLLLAGLALFLIAFAFKVGAVPFHFWVPDVYQGAPTPVTAFMAAGTKAAAFGVLLRVLYAGFSGAETIVDRWAPVIAGLAVATMVVGNVLALVQTRVKRLLAYSSVAHAGYLLLALVPATSGAHAGEIVGGPALLFYLFTYTFMTVGAFIVAALFQSDREDADHFAQFAGLWHRRPLLAAAMGVFLLSLTGIPPLGGFTGKYVIFLSVLDAGHPVLAAIMAIAAVIGAAYYLRVLMLMFIAQPEEDLAARLVTPGPARLALAVAVVATFVLGIAPFVLYDPLLTVMRAAAF
ncbi:MAG: NADH-quinone oxidoreductase subunit N [Acidobacteria bacterium]|nr:MAG: NADH-quinone oxidoreductase subunit N [Acidobacteriota bacterium]